MKKSEIATPPSYFDTYINQVEDMPLDDALQKSLHTLQSLNLDLLEQLTDLQYAPGKWTVHEVLQHVCDTERIFCYRALLFARGDTTVPPGFDEGLYAANANARRRPLGEIVAELIAVKQATIALFRSFDKTDLLKTGINWKYEMSVLAMGFAIVGHQLHHLKILRDRYLPLIPQSEKYT